MKKTIVYTLVLPSLLFAFSANNLYAQTTTQVTSDNKVTVSAGLTPKSFFYFLDIWAENISSLLNFTPEQKIKFEMGLAKERLAEYKEIKDDPEVDQSVKLETKEKIKEHVKNALVHEKEAEDNGEHIQSTKNDTDEDINDIDEDINSMDDGEANDSNTSKDSNSDKKIEVSLKTTINQKGHTDSFLETEVTESSNLLDKQDKEREGNKTDNN